MQQKSSICKYALNIIPSSSVYERVFAMLFQY